MLQENYALVYGLSAHPIHQAHIDLMINAVKALVARGYKIEKALLTPVYRRNPVGKRKDDLPHTYDHRFAMCELAAKEIERRVETSAITVEVSRIDEQLARLREEPNSTVETLSNLRTQHGNTGWLFLLSSDLVSGDTPELGQWHQPERLVKLATLVICPRPGYPRNETFLKGFEQSGAEFLYLDELTPGNMASSTIKQRLIAGEDPLALSEQGLLPRSVAMYIRDHALYKA